VSEPHAPASSQVCAAWATRDDLPDELPGELSSAEWDEQLLVATEILWALSGRQWSGEGCEATATLYVDQGRCLGWWPGSGMGLSRDYLTMPATHNQRAMKLPHPEIVEVTTVTAAGEAFTAFRRLGSWLFRTDERGWNELRGDVVVDYLWGAAPPAGGRRAVIAYAIELGKALAGDASCRLPKRVVSITRQGVAMSLIDPARYLDKGKLGMPDIDQWLSAVNPKAIVESGVVWSPDLLQAHPVQ
jgi:hypothetical protein